ncbi:MAG: Ig-like domain-containing protein [Bacteroidales bacterium]|jgi:hypothetical protein
MKRKILILSVLTMLAAVFVIDSCKKSPTAINLSTLMAGSVDLNGATAPTGLPLMPTITATFSTDVDATTATSDNITLTEAYDGVLIPLTISVSGAVITITPTANLANGALYTLLIGSQVKATSGEYLTFISRSFTTMGSFIPSGFVAYWNFDGNANDQTGNYSAATAGITDITYVAGRNTTAGQAAQFNGTTSLIEIAKGDSLMHTGDFSLSFWMKDDTTAKRDQFVMGLAAWFGFQFEYNSNIYVAIPPALSQIGQCKLAAQYSLTGGTSTSQDLWFDGTGNLGWQGWTLCKDLVSNSGTGVNGLLAQKWAHIVCTYDHASKIGTMYINGIEMKAQDFNLYGAPMENATGLVFAGNTDNNAFVFGFIQDKVDPTETDSWADYNDPTNGHFQGLLDDVVIYHKVLSASIVTQMYNSGKK